MDDNNNDEKRNVEGSKLVAAAAASTTDEEKGSRTFMSLQRRQQQQQQGPKRVHKNNKNNNHKNTDKETSIRQYTSAPTDHDQDEFEPSAVEQQDGEHSNNINIEEEEEEDFRDEAGEEEQQHLVEDEESHQPTQQQQQQQQQQGLASSWWQACFLPDRVPRLFGIPLLDGLFAVKFAKFVVVTMAGIALMHWFVRRMAWEHRSSFTLTDFWRYESTLVVVDALFYFTVGRMHQQRGVDHLAFLVTAGMAGLYASGITNFRFLQQSVTLYAMHCRWSWELWLFVLCLVPLIVTLILWHVQYAVQRGVFISKLLEMAGLSCLLLLLPSATSPYLHLHHWFAGWLLGMHANFNVWWSRATLAWCWGLYMNGIAVYGRDPVLTCGYTLFLSRQQGCPYLDCYLDGLNHPPPENSTVPPVQEMKTPDWRNCSADAYHP